MAGQEHRVREDFRPLTDREREILEFLLSVEISGIQELRRQMPVTRVARWDCGCASFDISVDRERATPSAITASPAVEAYSKSRDGVDNAFDLLLWVKDGWLAGVEIVDYVLQHGADSPAEIPAPNHWTEPHPPRVHADSVTGAATSRCEPNRPPA